MAHITIGQPEYEILTKKYTCVDMHIHTEHSQDSSMKLATIKKFATKHSIGVAITDHDQIKGNLLFKKKYPEIFQIPGIEVTTKEKKDVLMYFNSHKDLEDFYVKEIEPNKKKHRTNAFTIRTNISLNLLLDIGQDYNATKVLPHPFVRLKGAFRYLKNNQKFDTLNKIDAIEVINSSMPLKYNLNAINWAKLEQMPITAGSDSHIEETLGKAITYNKAKSIEEFLKAIRKNNSNVIGLSNTFRDEYSQVRNILKNKFSMNKNAKTTQLNNISN